MLLNFLTSDLIAKRVLRRTEWNKICWVFLAFFKDSAIIIDIVEFTK